MQRGWAGCCGRDGAGAGGWGRVLQRGRGRVLRWGECCGCMCRGRGGKYCEWPWACLRREAATVVLERRRHEEALPAAHRVRRPREPARAGSVAAVRVAAVRVGGYKVVWGGGIHGPRGLPRGARANEIISANERSWLAAWQHSPD